MKKIILSIILILFTISSCSCAKKNQYTTSGMINNVQTQMNGVMKSIRNMDNIYLEDYAINQINPISFNNPINYTGYYPNYNITPYSNYNSYNMYNNLPYNYSPYQYMYGYPYYYNYGYNNYPGTNYNIDTYKNFNSNVDTYMANNGIYSNPIIPGQSNNIIVSNNNSETKSVSNLNINPTSQYQTYNTYQPRYSMQNEQYINRSYLQNYISSIEDLFLITSDLNIANQKLTTLSNSIIELTVNIKNNIHYLNYNQTSLTSEQINIINEYVSTVQSIINNLKTSYGYIKNEVAVISKMKENFYMNAEALNAKYINILNIIETRILQLESLQTTLYRMNTQIINYINIFNPNILPFNQNFNQYNEMTNDINNNNNNNNEDELNINKTETTKELIDNNKTEKNDNSTNGDTIIQNGEENKVEIETNIIENNNDNTNTTDNKEENNELNIANEALENIEENNNEIIQVNEDAKELHDKVDELLNEIVQ